MNAFTFAKIKNLTGLFLLIFLWFYRLAVFAFLRSGTTRPKNGSKGEKIFFEKIET